MATKKQTAPKASDVLEKRQSDAAKRAETLSLFYAEGETFFFEGLPETTEHLVVKMFARDAAGTTHLVDVTAERVGDGTFKATVPELYVKEELETFAVCGVPIPARSYTQDEYFAWRDLARKYKLESGQAEMQRIRTELRKLYNSGVDVDNAKKRLPTFTKTRDELIKLEEKDLFAFAVSQDGQPSGQEKLEIVTTRIKELEAVIEEGDVDPISRLDTTSETGRRLEDLNRIDREAGLEFVHKLAVQDGLTDEPFEAWRKRATGDDFSNCNELMAVGNDFFLFGKDAEPLTRAERRQLMRQLNKEIKAATAEALKN